MLAACDNKPRDSGFEPLETGHRVDLDTRLLGAWAPYDNASNEQLGEAVIVKDFVRFKKASALGLSPVTGLSAKVGIEPAGGLCGDSPVTFVTFQMVEHPRPQSLKIAVYDQQPGPSTDPDFDLHRCQVFTYVRD